jgi:glycosyltransferase involved in cell wall biosynthesis
LTYPLAPGETIDFQFGFTDITTALAAQRVLFNSRTHLEAFFSILPDFLNMMPEFRPEWVCEAIRKKAGMVYPGCQFPAESKPIGKRADSPPIIIWNHRWEFDKNPAEFFTALDSILARDLDFQLALLGENFQTVPKEFISARERYGKRIVHYGYIESRDEYLQWLKRGSMVVSAAVQENFGISVVEASRFGCLPILPKRLSYPEIMPEELHPFILYEGREDLADKIAFFILNHSGLKEMREAVSKSMARYAWENVIGLYDSELEKLCG